MIGPQSIAFGTFLHKHLQGVQPQTTERRLQKLKERRKKWWEGHRCEDVQKNTKKGSTFFFVPLNTKMTRFVLLPLLIATGPSIFSVYVTPQPCRNLQRQTMKTNAFHRDDRFVVDAKV